MHISYRIVLTAALLGMSLVLPVIPGEAADMDKDLGGFSSLQWNDRLERVQTDYTVQKMGKEAGGTHYGVIIPEANGEMGLQGPVAVEAVFYDNKLSSIQIPMTGPFDRRMKALQSRYGDPGLEGDNFALWEGNKTIMTLRQEGDYVLLSLVQRPGSK
jgi:hypothetical protein